MTTTVLPDAGTDTRTVVDVDLDAVPMCQAGDDCEGEQGPAVARMYWHHRCDHREHVLICQVCYDHAVQWYRQLVRVTCAVCQDRHVCVLGAHLTLGEL